MLLCLLRLLPGSCTLETFRALLADRALNGSQWCAACNDSSTTACKLGTATTQLDVAQAQLAAAQGSSSSGGSASSSGTEGWKIAVSVVVTFVGTAALAGVAMWWAVRRERARWVQPMAMQMGEVGEGKA